ncbi:hypothetical protein [Flavobacterium sp. GCM10023249]|uniref:hypothetical protein n=1 Tax=unclassified Flavobacterium TaxID=196869 RepID=UPI00360DBA18
MKLLGTFEIHELIEIKVGRVLSGKYISGKSLSNKEDILKKNIFIRFRYHEIEITTKIIELGGRFGRPGQDIIMEENDNIALITVLEDATTFLNSIHLESPIIGQIIEK